MLHYTFYEVRSQQSKEYVNGLRKVSLSCEGHPDIHGFLWIDSQEQLQHIQLLFEEEVLEWNAQKGITASVTNRSQEVEAKIGFHKGIRSIHGSSSHQQALLHKLETSHFPEIWETKIQEKFR